MKKSLLFAIVLALAVPSLTPAEGLPDLGESSEADLSPASERKIGEQAMNEIRLREPSYLDDPEVTAYLNDLGRRLAAQADGAPTGFEFFALRDPTINAFAMPGGFIGVHSGLFRLAQSESELAAVLAHEVSHVTQHHLARQLRPQGQSQLIALAAFAAAIVAARNNPNLAQGAIMAGQGVAIQNQLSYSRDFEREADRLGLNLLDKGGYDIRAMEIFFGRMQKANRLYETNAQSYLMTHPLSTERMADMANRINQRNYRQAASSDTFWLVRAKLTAMEGTPQDALATFRTQIRERKFGLESAAHYGMAQALMRNNKYKEAEAELQLARSGKTVSSLFDTLAADLQLKQNDMGAALTTLAAAKARYPQSKAVTYRLLDTQIRTGKAQEALQLSRRETQGDTTDPKLYEFQARSYAALGKILQQHRAQAEVYALSGQNTAAIEQLMIAQKAPDGDFYEHSQVDARLKQLREIESANPRKGPGNEDGRGRFADRERHHEH